MTLLRCAGHGRDAVRLHQFDQRPDVLLPRLALRRLIVSHGVFHPEGFVLLQAEFPVGDELHLLDLVAELVRYELGRGLNVPSAVVVFRHDRDPDHERHAELNGLLDVFQDALIAHAGQPLVLGGIHVLDVGDHQVDERVESIEHFRLAVEGGLDTGVQVLPLARLEQGQAERRLNEHLAA